MKHKVRIYEMRRQVHQEPGKAPTWVERPAFVMTLEVEADSIDQGRDRARALVSSRMGRAPRSVNCVHGGGYTAIVPASTNG